MVKSLSVAVVTDSIADVPEAFVAANPVFVVPAIVVIGGESLEDGKDISREEYYSRLPALKPAPTTAAPAVGTFEQLYQDILSQGYEKVISLHAPVALTAIYRSAYIASQRFGENVRVFDCGQLTLGLGFQVMALVEALRAGACLDEALERMAATRRRIHLVAMLDTLEYIRRSGRVSWAAASLGTLLNLKPFIDVKEGEVRRMGETRTRRRGIERLHGLLAALGPLERLAILHTNAEAEAGEFLAHVRQPVEKPAFIANVTTVIGTHVGPHGLGFVAVPVG
ncbi:MAG: DegV family protein [Chloroflexota bacterium]